MNCEPPNSADHVDPLQEQLVAYLDGELDADTCRIIEERLSEDPELRRRLSQHQRAWDLLAEVPRAEADDSFAHTTVEMVALSAAGDVQRIERSAWRRRRFVWTLGTASALVAAFAGYFAMALWLSLPERRLAEDLPIIENLDAYRNAESVDFLRKLEHAGLFTEELEDGL